MNEYTASRKYVPNDPMVLVVVVVAVMVVRVCVTVDSLRKFNAELQLGRAVNLAP